MAITRADVRNEVALRLLSSGSNRFPAATLNGWIDQGLRDVSRRVPVFVERCGILHTVGSDRVDPAAQIALINKAEIISIAAVYWKDFGRLRVLSPGRMARDYPALVFRNQSDPNAVSLRGLQLHIEPPPSTAASSSTINQVGGISASDTSVTLSDASAFRTRGFCKIESEWIGWSGKSGNTLQNLVRGVGPTAAAAHANNTTVTQADLVIDYRRTSQLSVDDVSSLDLPGVFFEVLVRFCLVRAAEQTREIGTSQNAFAHYLSEIRRLEADYSDFMEEADEQVAHDEGAASQPFGTDF